MGHKAVEFIDIKEIAATDRLFDQRPGFHLQAWNHRKDQVLSQDEAQHHFGFVLRGEMTLHWHAKSFPISRGMYFSAPGSVRLVGAGAGILISQNDYQGLFSLGGPIEQRGRLHYIDGCSDTLLIPPTIRGDACLNLLYLPPGTNQTMHTHPSFRFGMIVDGGGCCDDGIDSEPLHAGKIFFIASNGIHRFRTMDEALRVIAFHPDSDFGPHHDEHPMVNRTMVNGISAAELTHQQRGINY